MLGVVIQAARVHRNIERLAGYAASHGVAVRPRRKTHKSVEVARLQLAAGAGGLTVPKWATMKDLGMPQTPMHFMKSFVLTLLPLFVVSASLSADPAPRELFSEAVRLFFEAKPVESARVFDQLVVAVPGAEPELWQRGLALYYAERYEDGRKQFELHKTVNPNDVENPAWHFLCVARLDGPEAARKALLPVGEDFRVPMAAILSLYAGRGTEAAVLEAAEKGEGEAKKNQLCYAHLYLGLYAEALGDEKKARHHITRAAGPYRMDHYMGKVAVDVLPVS